MTLQEIQQKIEEFKNKGDDDFKIYTNSFISALKAVKENPSTVNVKEYEKANRAIEEYFKKKEAEASNEIRFQNILDVSGYLQSVGWKISKSKLYADRGIIKTQADGAYLKKDVDKYAEQFLRKLDGSDIDSDPLEKLKEETRLTKAKADKEELLFRVLQKKYIDIAQVERTRTAQTAKLLLIYENLVYGKAEKLIELVAGDMTKKHELQKFLLSDKWFFGALHEFAKKDQFIFSLPTKKMLEADELFNGETG